MSENEAKIGDLVAGRTESGQWVVGVLTEGKSSLNIVTDNGLLYLVGVSSLRVLEARLPKTEVDELIDRIAGWTLYIGGGKYSADSILPNLWDALRAVALIHRPGHGDCQGCGIDGNEDPIPYADCPVAKAILRELSK